MVRHLYKSVCLFHRLAVCTASALAFALVLAFVGSAAALAFAGVLALAGVLVFIFFAAFFAGLGIGGVILVASALLSKSILTCSKSGECGSHQEQTNRLCHSKSPSLFLLRSPEASSGRNLKILPWTCDPEIFSNS